MWSLFHKKLTALEQERLDSFEDTLKSLERRVKSVEMDWELAYDKLHQLMGRIAKRAEKLHNEAESAGKLAPLPEEESLVEPLPERFSYLTARQRQIQQNIMNRRRAPNGRPQ